MDDILKGLNDAQKAAVTSNAAVLQILAPPGSGKTKTLTTRVANMIAHEGLNPRNIVVCTFTVKAAREMKERIRSFLGDDLAGQLILGTFHSICRRFLAKYGKHVNIDANFGICDSSDTLSILTRIIKSSRYNLQPAVARSRISRYKSQGTLASELTSSKKVEQQELAHVYAKYEDALTLANLLDYDDLLLRCIDLLKHYPSCVQHIDAILIDEFQDTNNVQFELMTLLAQAQQRITIVGDPDQSIYGFRSAEVKNLTKMREQYSDTHVINLEENYRSSGAILLAAMEVIEQDQSRPAKKLKATHSIGMQPVLRKLPSSAAEALWIVTEIQRTAALTGRLLQWSDYAVLLRSAALSRLIEAELGKAGIPYRMVGGHRFFDRMEVKLVLDYLRVIDHPDHNDAVARVVNVPSRKVGDATIQKLLQEADEKHITLWTLIHSICRGTRRPCSSISNQAQRGLELFTHLILTSQKKLEDEMDGTYTLGEFVRFVVQKIGIQDYLKKTKSEDYETRWANVEELVAQASDPAVEAARSEEFLPDISNSARADEDVLRLTIRQSLSTFLSNVALSTEAAKQEDDAGKRIEQVTLSTIHASKGLEWPVVFVPAAYEGSIPHSRAEDNDEERRLLYVAMTRAQCMLYLSCPQKNSRYELTTLSGFLSKNPLSSYFATHGPVITCDELMEMANVLRRDCPTAAQIEELRSQLEQMEDNKWAGSGDEDENNTRRWDYKITEKMAYEAPPAFKRPRLDGSLRESTAWIANRIAPVAGLSQRTTIEQYGANIVHATSRNALFVTASTALIQQNQENIDCENARKEAGIKWSAAEQKKTTSRVITGQTSLTKFFAKSGENITSDKGVIERVLRDLDGGSKLRLTETTNVEHERNDSQITGEIRPASTTHITSVAGFQRRTLGVRRSLNGWHNRKNQ